MNHQTYILPSGFRIGVSMAGTEGVPLVFFHGLSVSATAYAELLTELGERGFRVIAFDAANHGRSSSLPWGHTVEEMIDVAIEALDALGIYTAVFVGHSMGGGMVVELAARYPERVLAAILMDAAAGRDHHEGIAVAPGRNIPVRAARIAVGGLIDVVGDGVAAMRNRTHRERLSLLSLLKESVGGCRFVRSAFALMKADTVPLLQAMKRQGVRTAVIHGINDQIVPLKAGVSAMELSGGLLYLVDGFHSWMLADPEYAADLIGIAMEDLYPIRHLMGAEA